MFGRIDAGVHLRNLSGGIDQEGVAGGELYDSEVGERPVGVHHFMARVSQQFEVETFFRAELFVRVHAVAAHS